MYKEVSVNLKVILDIVTLITTLICIYFVHSDSKNAIRFGVFIDKNFGSSGGGRMYLMLRNISKRTIFCNIVIKTKEESSKVYCNNGITSNFEDLEKLKRLNSGERFIARLGSGCSYKVLNIRYRVLGLPFKRYRLKIDCTKYRLDGSNEKIEFIEYSLDEFEKDKKEFILGGN